MVVNDPCFVFSPINHFGVSGEVQYTVIGVVIALRLACAVNAVRAGVHQFRRRLGRFFKPHFRVARCVILVICTFVEAHPCFH
ncbi:hypothetical protein D3C87_1619950 [compost metagenome]